MNSAHRPAKHSAPGVSTFLAKRDASSRGDILREASAPAAKSAASASTAGAIQSTSSSARGMASAYSSTINPHKVGANTRSKRRFRATQAVQTTARNAIHCSILLPP